MNRHEIIDRTISVVVAYVAHNRISQTEVPLLIQKTYSMIADVMEYSSTHDATSVLLTKKQISDTIHNDYIVSLIDGRKYKTLKRHLHAYGLSPERYRAKYDLPDDYPMVAANYSSVRRRIAKEVKLGQKVA